MLETLYAALTAVSLALGGLTAVDIEDRRRAAAEARQIIDDALARADAVIAEAERNDDVVTAARALAIRDQLVLVRRRTNPAAMQRQADQMYGSFRDGSLRALPTAVMGGPGGAMVDALGVATTLGSDGSEDPWPLVDRLRQRVGEVEGSEPLPDTLSQYIAESELHDLLDDPELQLGGAPAAQRARFICEQLSRTLGDRIAHEADLDRQRALMAARDRACTVRAEGELDFPAQAALFLSRIDTNQVELAYRIDGEAEGRVRLVAALNAEAVEGIGEAAGAAAAGAVGGGGSRRRPATRCSYRAEIDLRLQGRDTGGRSTGTARVASGHLEKRCGGGHERDALGNEDVRVTWTATERADGLAFVLQIGEMPIPAELRLDVSGEPVDVR